MDILNAGRMLPCQREFVAERQWEKFHTPKNLSMALTIEAAELMEIFQWLSPAEARRIMQDRQKGGEVTDELADIFYYLLRLADTLGVNLEEAFWSKMGQNRAKYPVRLARGNAKKHEAFLRGKGLHRRGKKRAAPQGAA